MYFDNWSPVESLAAYDNYGDDTVAADDFEVVMLREVTSLSKAEASALTEYCPRVEEKFRSGPIAKGLHARSSERRRAGTKVIKSLGDRQREREMDNLSTKEVRIFYVRLCAELTDLARLALPINMIYERFEPPLASDKPEPVVAQREQELANMDDF